MSRMLSALQRIEAKSAGEEPASPKGGPDPKPAKTKKPDGASEPAADTAGGADKEKADPASGRRPADSPAARAKPAAPEAEPKPLSRPPSEPDRAAATLEKVARLVDSAQKGDLVPTQPRGQDTAAKAQPGKIIPQAAPQSPPKKDKSPPGRQPTTAPTARTTAPPEAEPSSADSKKRGPAPSKARSPQPAPAPSETAGRPNPSGKISAPPDGVDSVKAQRESRADTPGAHGARRHCPVELEPHWHRLAETILSEWAGREPVVLMFSSPEENESRAAAGVCLAAALAAAAPDEILLVDANLCEPALAGRLGVVADPSLVDVLVGTAAWQRAVRPTCVRGLALLPGRAAVTDTPVHLRSLGPVIEEVRRHYRFVLVAATSVGYGDTAAIARWCDGVYLWIRLNKTPCRTALQAIDMIERHGGKVAGCVLAEVPGT